MSCTDFPSTGLIPNVTTHTVGNITYIWTGIAWESQVNVPAGELVNDLSQAYIFETVADYQASTIVFPVGKTIHLNDRQADFTVIAGTGTANGFDIIANSSTGQSVDLFFSITDPLGLSCNNLGLTYDSRGESANEGTDNTDVLQRCIDKVKTKPVGLFGEFTGGKISVGFGGLLITSELNLKNNASVSVSGLGKTKSNIFASLSMTDDYMLNMTGSNNCRNEIKGLRLTTVGGSEGVIRSGVNAMGSDFGANQIDIKENWVNNLQSMYSGVASDSSLKDNAAEYCRQFVIINGGGSRDLDISENVIYNVGNIGLPDDSDPVFDITDTENLTLARNRIINDSPVGPHTNGVFRLTNVDNFDITDQKFNDSQKYVGKMFNIDGGYGRITNMTLPSLTDSSIRAQNCSKLTIDQVTTAEEKAPKNNTGVSISNCDTVSIGKLEIGRTGFNNISLNGCNTVTIDTLILNGADTVAAGFDNSIRIISCQTVVINNLIIKQQSAGTTDIFADASVSRLIINNVTGTTLSRIDSTAITSIITNVSP